MTDSGVVATGRLGVLRRIYLRRRYAILFYTLLLTIVAVPLVAVFELESSLIDFFLAANLLAAVMPAGAGRGRDILLAIMTLLWLARSATAWFDHPALAAMSLGLWTLIGLLAAAAAMRFVMRAKLISAEHLYAALSAYLLAGIFFGHFYWVLQQIRPGTFAVTGDFSRMSAIYFSFITLATIGYGDIVPRSDLARGLAILEGVGGQLFLTVLVARLVSVYTRENEAN
jgi:hypothetical protein